MQDKRRDKVCEVKKVIALHFEKKKRKKNKKNKKNKKKILIEKNNSKK